MNADDTLPDNADCAVAIIGMDGRFPGAPDLDAYWSLLDAGREGISHFTPEELEVVPVGLRADDPRLVRAQGVLDDVEMFDAPFFNVPAREARWLDPQQRIFLETCWNALENAGYDAERCPDAISVYGGVNANSYLLSRLHQFERGEGGDLFQVMLASEKDFLATRVAYKLNLRGESIGVQTSCSTSLVAVHMACQSLLSGQSTIALAGGVSVRVPQRAGYVYQEGMIASPDGHCRAFDAAAQGTVPGSGVGVVVLKLLADALRDGDHVHAVILGSAINNDGRAKAGFTAPSVAGQSEVIAKAIAMAGVEPDSIGMIEAHGTGTPLGDPIEVEALTRAFRRRTQRRGYCALGSVKSNIGHLDAAAGVAGLIKAVLALRHKRIPATVHFSRANPALQLEQSPFFVASQSQDWNSETPRRCGVSSFGVGGTNAHVVLEEAPLPAPRSDEARPRLFALSARTPGALRTAATRLAAHVETHPQQALDDVAATLALGRREFAVRASVVAADRESLAARLRELAATAKAPAPGGRLAFLLAGQGAAFPGMAEELLRSVAPFRRAFENCAVILRSRHGLELQELVYPAVRDAAAASRLQAPAHALPALFALEYAQAQMWRSFGVEPDCLIGHSFGEYVAACLAGVFSLEDGLRIAVERGRLMQRLPAGAMLAIQAGEDDAHAWLGDGVELATINGPAATVVSGTPAAIEALAQRLDAAGIAASRLAVDHAYHSQAIDGIGADLRALLASVTLQAPAIPFASNLSGDWISAAEATDPDYWVRQMRQPVRFSQGLETLRRGGAGTFLEIGPGQTLAPMVKRVLPAQADEILCTLPRANARGSSDSAALLATLGRLWTQGRPVRWESVLAERSRRRVPLPTYPFERQRYWIERIADSAVAAPAAIAADANAAAEAAASAPDAQSAPAATPETTAARHAVKRGEISTAYAVAQDDIEGDVIAAWEAVLGISGVGRDDNFFELGGDSLLGTQVYARLAPLYPARLQLQDVLFEGSVAALAARIRTASADGAPVITDDVIPRVARDGDLPLSFGQEWLWSVDQAFPGSAAYNFPFAARVRGDLDPRVLGATLDAIVERHEVLRSTYPIVDGVPVQRIHAAAPRPLPVLDLSALPEDARMAQAHEIMETEARQPFDLAAGPLIRSQLLRLGDNDHLVVVTLHHIVSDAWSMGLFARDLAAFYPALRDARPSGLPPLSVQYADYAAWQRRRIDDTRAAALVDYWTRQLAGAPQLVELPADRPRPPRPSGRGARIPFAFDRALAGELRRVGRARKSTLFMVLLAGFSALLHRLNGQEEMLIGIPIAGRTQAQTEDLIGCFINTVAIRTGHAGNPRFEALLEQVRDTTLAAYAHQEIPFERVVRACQVQRVASHSPLVQVLFDFQNIPPRPPLRIDGLDIAPLGAELATAKLDLVVDMWEREDGLAGSVEFNTDLFDSGTIERLMRQYEALLTDIAQRPEARLGALALQSEAEREQARRQRDAQSASQRDRFRQFTPKAVTGKETPA